MLQLHCGMKLKLKLMDPCNRTLSNKTEPEVVQRSRAITAATSETALCDYVAYCNVNHNTNRRYPKTCISHEKEGTYMPAMYITTKHICQPCI